MEAGSWMGVNLLNIFPLRVEYLLTLKQLGAHKSNSKKISSEIFLLFISRHLVFYFTCCDLFSHRYSPVQPNVSGVFNNALGLIFTSLLLLLLSGCLCDGGLVVAIFPPGWILLDVCWSNFVVLLHRTSVRRLRIKATLVLRLCVGLVFNVNKDRVAFI